MNYFNSSIALAMRQESDVLHVILVHPSKVSDAIKAVSSSSPGGTTFKDGAWVTPKGKRTKVATYPEAVPSEPFILSICNDGVVGVQGEFEHWIAKKKSR